MATSDSRNKPHKYKSSNMSYDYQTSLPAYQEAKVNINQKQKKVLSAIDRLKPCNDMRIANFLGWPINTVTPRRLELLEKGLIASAGKKKDPSTGRTVNYWTAK